jgi:quinolinate synthase
MSDIICTSSNAEKIIDSLLQYEKIIFASDKLLGTYLKGKTGRDLLLWNGSCQVHEIFSEKELILLKTRHPSALVLAHPECNDDILHHAHHIGSTTSIIHFTIESTENDGCACNECPHMRLNTLEKMMRSLETIGPEISIPDDIRIRTLKPLERMLALS